MFTISGELLTLTQNDGSTDIVTFDHDTKATNFKGNATFGDNDKAVFGAGSDLEIYHNANTSFITESGSGNLKIGGENLYLQNTAHNENYLEAIANGAVTLYYNGSAKIATTSTGIDVTGTVVADGLTVDDISIDGSTISDAGNLTIDAGGDITLDADGGDIIFADGGTEFGSVGNSSGSMFIEGLPTAGKVGLTFYGSSIEPRDEGSASNGAVDLGATGSRFKDLHLSGNAYASTYRHDGDSDTYLNFPADNSLSLVAGGAEIVRAYQIAGAYGVLRVNGSGSATYPNFTFNGDDNTGMYSAGADTLAFTTGGTERVRIDSSGRVGIGTSSMGAPLHITNATPVIRFTDSDTSRNSQIVGVDGNLRLDADNDNQQSSTNISFRTDGTERARFTSTGLGIGTTASRPLHVVGADGGLALFSNNVDADLNIQTASAVTLITPSTGTLAFGTSSTERARIDSSGNVGIGTSSPASNLHIKTSVDNSVAQGLVIERSANSDKGYINYNGGAFQFRSTVGDPIVFGETDSEHLRIAPDGNIGIGTSSPNTPLQVSGANSSTNADALFSVQKTTEGYGLFSGVLGTGTSWLQGGTANDATDYSIALQPNGGNLGIGTTTPQKELHVHQNSGADCDIHMTNNATGSGADQGLTIFSNSGSAGIIYRQSAPLTFSTASTERMRINSSGQVLIGSTASVDAGFLVVKADPSTYNHIVTIPTSNASYNALAMNNSGGTRIGAISVGTNITYGGTSDYRLKENIVPMEKGLERVKKLKPVKFNWKEDGSSSEGFIAHEIQEAGWEVGVEGHKDGEEMQMVEYGKLTPLLVKAIQEQQELIEDLQTQINNLRGK